MNHTGMWSEPLDRCQQLTLLPESEESKSIKRKFVLSMSQVPKGIVVRSHLLPA